MAQNEGRGQQIIRKPGQEGLGNQLGAGCKCNTAFLPKEKGTEEEAQSEGRQLNFENVELEAASKQQRGDSKLAVGNTAPGRTGVRT